MSKKRKKLLMMKIIIYSILIVILISVALSFVFFSGVFSVKEIQVINNNKVDSETIIANSNIKLDENVFLVNKNRVRDSLSSIPYIEDVSVRSIIPNKIEINVKERSSCFVVKSNDSFYSIDNNGVILEKVTDLENNSALVIVISTEIKDDEIGKELSEKDKTMIKNIETILQVAESNEVDKLITKFDVTNEQDIIIEIASESKYAHLGSFNDDIGLNMKFFWLKTMLEQEKGKSGVIYLNVDLNKNKVVFSEQSF